ncbi:hypothetical protein NFI96_007246 [Prochilodus magdalenae]|nr:hypothetical protein NFI96_007246 [Prochilodus magdalenae]
MAPSDHQILKDLFGSDIGSLLLAQPDIMEGSAHRPAPSEMVVHGLTPPSVGVVPQRAVPRLLLDFLSTQRKLRGRSRKSPARGCFGMKVDRIGALSGLGGHQTCAGHLLLDQQYPTALLPILPSSYPFIHPEASDFEVELPPKHRDTFISVTFSDLETQTGPLLRPSSLFHIVRLFFLSDSPPKEHFSYGMKVTVKIKLTPVLFCFINQERERIVCVYVCECEHVVKEKEPSTESANIIQHDWCGGGSVMVWGGISLEGATDLYRLDHGPLTAIRYQDEILGPIARPYTGAVGPGFLLVHNNARPHVARVCRQFLENKGIDTIDWPTGSTDLNPTEHLWDIMFRSIRRHQVALQTVQELSDALVQIWERSGNPPEHHLSSH